MAWAVDRIGGRGVHKHRDYAQRRVVTFVVLGCLLPRYAVGRARKRARDSEYNVVPPPLFFFSIMMFIVQSFLFERRPAIGLPSPVRKPLSSLNPLLPAITSNVWKINGPRPRRSLPLGIPQTLTTSTSCHREFLLRRRLFGSSIDTQRGELYQ